MFIEFFLFLRIISKSRETRNSFLETTLRSFSTEKLRRFFFPKLRRVLSPLYQPENSEPCSQWILHNSTRTACACIPNEISTFWIPRKIQMSLWIKKLCSRAGCFEVSNEFRKITDKTSKVMKQAVSAKSRIEQERTRYEAAAGALQAAAEADLDAATQDASDQREKVGGYVYSNSKRV